MNTPLGEEQIGHVRYINIHKWLQGFIVKFNYCFI